MGNIVHYTGPDLRGLFSLNQSSREAGDETCGVDVYIGRVGVDDKGRDIGKY